MLQHTTDDLRIISLKPIVSPDLLLHEFPLSESAIHLIQDARQQIHHILTQRSDKLLVIVGPCSIHDPSAAIEYGQRMRDCIQKYRDELCIVMRVYFEKPRTTVGWKGLINDPTLNNRFDINQGLRTARELLLKLNQLAVPTASEFLDTIVPQYISDLITWAAIGARTTESQVHRELSSGLSMPVGFKNATAGDIDVAVDAVYTARQTHHFLGVSKQGIASIVATQGNEDCHIILRGSKQATNYDAQSIAQAEDTLQSRKLPLRIMVDCSHGNSQKDYRQQKTVLASLCQQIRDGNRSIFGVMIESNLLEGKQNLNPHHPLIYGQSVTDSCIGWEETETLLSELCNTVKTLRKKTK